MADYDLGTAHGKIVVDYQDKGTAKAAKDLESLKAKAGELLGKFAGLAKGWRSHSQGMVADITKLSKAVGIFAGGMAVAVGVLGRSRSAFLAFKGANQIFSSLGLAMGSVPKGAEGFPGVVKKAIQLSAAITLFAGSTKLIQTVLSRFALLGGLGNLIGNFGSKVNSLAGPLHKFAGLALSAANAVVAFRAVRSIIKPLLMFGGAIAAVGGAAHLIAGLATSIADLSGAAGLLPAVLGAAGLAALTFKLGISGLSDAFKNLDDPAKFAEALKNLSPAAREFAVAVREIYTKGFKELKLDVQERLFKGLGKVVQDLGGKYMPVLRDVMGRVADHLNGVAFGIGGVLKSGEGFTNLSISLGLFEKIIGNVGKAVPQLLRALLGIMRISAQVFEPLTRGAGDAAKRFADFVNSAEGATKIKAWIESGVQALRDLWGIVKNVGLALAGMWKGLNGGEARSFLGVLNELTAKFNAFIRSAEGQRVLKLLGDQFEKLWVNAQKLGDAFVKNVLPALEKFLPVIAEISSGVIDGLVVAMQVLGPLFEALGTILGPIAPVLGEIVKWMVALGAILIGVGAGVKVLANVFSILKLAFDAGKLAFGAAGFAARLLTGNLKGAELQALKLGAAMGKNAAGGILSFVRNSKLIKGAALAVALGAIAYEMDQINIKAAGGADKLQGFEENLHDIVGAGEMIASGDISGIFADINEDLTTMVRRLQTGESAIGKFFGWLKRQMTEPLPPMDFNVNTGPAKDQVDGFINQVNKNSPTVNINGNTNGAGFALREILAEIAAGKSEVVIDGEPMPAQEALQYVMGLITNSNGEITINGETKPAGEALAEILRQTNSSTGTFTIDGNKDPATNKVQQAVTFADGSKGTITIDGNQVPADGKTKGAVRFADGSTGTITIDGNQTPANGKVNATVTYANGRTGTIKVDANAAPANTAIQGIVNKWQGYTIRMNVGVGGSFVSSRVGGMATGGPVRGRGTGTSDSILAMLSNGEYVATAKQVRAAGGTAAFARLMSALEGGVMPKFAGGGSVGTVSAGSPVAGSNVFNVTLDAKSVADMQSVADFFGKVQQKARAGKAGR